MPVWIIALLEQVAPVILQAVIGGLTSSQAHAEPPVQAQMQAKIDKHQAALDILKK